MIQRLTLVLALAFILFSASSALARIDVTPYITLQQQYTDNINLTADNKQEEWITTIAPGIRLGYSSRLLTADVNYSMNYRFYKNNSDYNQKSFRDAQRADVSFVFFQGRPFTLGVSQSIAREAVSARAPFSPDNERINSTTVYRTSISPQYRLRLTPTLAAVAGYVYNRVDYVSSAGEDIQSHMARLSLVNAVTPNLDVSANYRYTWHLSDRSGRDYDTQSYTLGLDYRIGPRTHLSLEGGYSFIEYEDGRDRDSIYADTEVSYRITAPLTLSLFYNRSFSPSATEGAGDRQQAGMRLGYDRERLTASTELFWRHVDYLRTNREDDVYGVRSAVGYRLMPNVRANVDAGYEIADYDPENERVKILSLGTSLNYNYRFLNVTLGYRYRDRSADTRTREFSNNIVTLTVTASY